MSIVYNILANISISLTEKHLLGEIKNRENLNFEGPKIIIANHSSYLDHFVVGTLLRKELPNQKIYFLTKKEAFDKKISRWWHKNMNCIPIDRDGDSTAAMMTLKRSLLKENALVVIYPEGTRTPTGNIYLGKPGAEFLSYITGVPIVPIGMQNLFDILPRKRKRVTKKRVNVTIGTSRIISKKEKRNLEKISDEHMKNLAILANERLSLKRVGEFNQKQEMLEQLVLLNELGIRNYPKSSHSPLEYHKRVIYIGKTLISEYELEEEEEIMVYIELARAQGRIAIISGVFTLAGQFSLWNFKKFVHKAENIDESNSELLYIKGNYHYVKKDIDRTIAYLEKAVEIRPYSIKYMLLLSKAYNLYGSFDRAIDLLEVIKQTPSNSQVDLRRKMEASALLMRLEPFLELEINHVSESKNT